MKKEMFLGVEKNFLAKERFLSPYATKSSEGTRLQEIKEPDIRPAFYRDIDRIIYSLSYTRYVDKTQVFSFRENDHISKRMIHVQLVSKVARTIGRALGLNEDLIEAIALGHDIGHTPLGHEGEKILNEISQKELHMTFAHNLQSVRTLMNLENHGKGNNLTIQVLDGIMCHNGEMPSNIYRPIKKTKEEFLEEYQKCYTDKEVLKTVTPMTLEGCVVRISDIIAYLGRDIEDAIEIGVFKREDLPKEITDVLGNNNHDIVNTLIMDVIENSLGKDYIQLSDKVYKALFHMKNFNAQNIYLKANTDEDRKRYKEKMVHLYKEYLKDLEENNQDSVIFKVYLNTMSKDYIENTDPKRIVIDFIAGMTDDYFFRSM